MSANLQEIRDVCDIEMRMPDGQLIKQSELLSSGDARKKYLSMCYRAKQSVSCMCCPGGVEMGISLRTHPWSTYYLRSLHINDYRHHAWWCPYSEPRNGNGSENASLPVIEKLSDGSFNMNLAGAEYYVDTESGANRPGYVLLPGEKSQVLSVSARGSMLSMLQMLYWLGGLNMWSPAFNEKRNYYTVQSRILNAAKKLRISNRELHGRIYMPLFHPRDENVYIADTERFNRFVTGLKTDKKGRRWTGFVVGVLRSVEYTGDGCVQLQLAHSNRPIRATAGQWQHIKHSWFGGNFDLRRDQPQIVLMRVERPVNMQAPGLQLVDIAVISLADNNCWIPVDSEYERVFAWRLVRDGYRFNKPLAVQYRAGERYPDFVLTDFFPCVIVEILGRMRDPVYRTKTESKLAAYDASGVPQYRWDPVASPEMPPLPPLNRGRRA